MASTGVNISGNKVATTGLLPAQPGDCITGALEEELNRRLFAWFDEDLFNISSRPCVADDSNNIASVTDDGCILVPSVKVFSDIVVGSWTEGDTSLTVVLPSGEGIDAANSFWNIEPGPAGNFSSWQVVSKESDGITIEIQNPTSDIEVSYSLMEPPAPGQI